VTPELIARIVDNAQLARELLASVAAGLANSFIDLGRDPARHFATAVDRVTISVESHPTVSLLRELILDDAGRTNEEVRTCLEFIYAHMVSKFQGHLGEFLAMGVCSRLLQDWKREGRFPPEAKVLWGADLRQRWKEGTAWLQGADGFFVLEEKISDGADLMILSVLEVKSHRRKVRSQVSKHVQRLRYGLKANGREWQPHHLSIGLRNARRRTWSKVSVLADPAPRPLLVLVRPAALRRRELSMWQRGMLTVTLPCSRGVLAAAAYATTVWFLEELGRRAFTTTLPPWPEMTPAEAGFNAVKQALYYIPLREGLSARAAWIATRLYNVYGFGFEAAKGHRDMIWSVRGRLVSAATDLKPSGDTRGGATLEELVDWAWAHYRRCEMPEALELIDRAFGMAPGELISRRLQWLRAMVHYFRAEFDEAVRDFPPPRDQSDPWWARDKLTKTRALVRLGRLDDAQREINEVASARLDDPFVLVSLQMCEGLLALKRGQLDAARQGLEGAFAGLMTEAAELERRRRQGLGLHRPGAIDPSGLAKLAAEMLPGYVALGEYLRATELLNYARGVFPPYRLLITLDPEIGPLRSHPELGWLFDAWLREEHRSQWQT
jgi:tetratricopeptide (TPR) repeat protein